MIIVKQLAGCLVRACPVRFASGEPRLCHDHARDSDGVHAAAEALGIELRDMATQAPVGSREVTQAVLFTRSGQVEGESLQVRGMS